jgi:hypothetical protein
MRLTGGRAEYFNLESKKSGAPVLTPAFIVRFWTKPDTTLPHPTASTIRFSGMPLLIRACLTHSARRSTDFLAETACALGAGRARGPLTPTRWDRNAVIRSLFFFYHPETLV